MPTTELRQPNNLEEAFEILDEVTGSNPENHKILQEPENEFLGMTHHGFGTGLRNGWYLWWSEDLAKEAGPDYPQEKPTIVKFFNDLGLYHADDMSGIILTSYHRHKNGKELDIEGQVEHYKKHWRKMGFEDGIPK